MGILFVILGTAAIAGGIFAKEFYVGDVLSGDAYKQKSSKWSGRLVFIVVGACFVALGIRLLIGSG